MRQLLCRLMHHAYAHPGSCQGCSRFNRNSQRTNSSCSSRSAGCTVHICPHLLLLGTLSAAPLGLQSAQFLHISDVHISNVTSGASRAESVDCTARGGWVPGMSAILMPPLQERMGSDRHDLQNPIIEPPLHVTSHSSPMYICTRPLQLLRTGLEYGC